MRKWLFLIIGTALLIFLFTTDLFENSFDESYNPKNYIQSLTKVVIQCNQTSSTSEDTNIKYDRLAQKVQVDSSIYDNFTYPAVDIEVNGHEIKFNRDKEKKNPDNLTIHLIFHSHVDPGWLKTFENYFKQQTSDIINSAVKALYKYPDLRFIWSETSFLERWWRDASINDRKRLTDLVHNGKLEITGGAWVMTDEATPLFYPAIENMIEGHQFIWDTLKVRPNTSWSVDPFGHGAMLPYLLPSAGIDYMVIGRFHDHIKEHLRQKQTLRWRWNDLYTNEKSSGPYVNSLPYFVYTTESACPDSSVCRCFHVGPTSRVSCPQQDKMVNLNPPKIEKMTKQFVEQIKKVQHIYGSENLLVAIGDDFFFQRMEDFDLMYKGFKEMANYVEKHPEMKTKIRFSTVSEFYQTVKDDEIPSLRGDLFPYTSNRNQPNPWWTGYFTHRPYSKRMERVLQANVQQLDLLLHLEKSRKYDYEALRHAKRNLALYQHHDGITGTSTKPVMADYEIRMVEAYKTTKEEFRKLLNTNVVRPELKESISILEYVTSDKYYITVFNSNIYSIKHEIRINAVSPSIIKYNNITIPSQNIRLNDSAYEILFSYMLSPISTTIFTVEKEPTNSNLDKFEDIAPLVQFDKNSFPIGIIKDGVIKHLNIEFFVIEDAGGAYTFEPRSNPKYLNISNYEEFYGPSSYKRRLHFKDSKLIATISNTQSINDGINIEVETDVKDNHALFISLSSNIQTEYFHTDINGLHHRKRKYSKQMDGSPLPYESNFYPVSSSVFLEDDKSRLTVLTGQPLSATSPSNGKLHLMMDRRQTGQDGKGLWYGDALDNRSAFIKYRILLEDKIIKRTDVESPALSALATSHWNDMLYPPTVFSSTAVRVNKNYFDFQWPCTIQLVSWRPISNKTSLIILRRTVFDSKFELKLDCSGTLDNIFKYLQSRSSLIQHTSLSGTQNRQNVTIESLKDSLKNPYSIVTLRIED